MQLASIQASGIIQYFSGGVLHHREIRTENRRKNLNQTVVKAIIPHRITSETVFKRRETVDKTAAVRKLHYFGLQQQRL